MLEVTRLPSEVASPPFQAIPTLPLPEELLVEVVTATAAADVVVAAALVEVVLGAA